ncbi:protein TOO MANY MOUTHS-like [Durio zibethinus]|uniref:Protein TOO MANY MOUTHS-like n=1 Tax=Durio zibethinus TaxID=66656 RepID=A0A6P5YL81_DURZI|nr:protein TOO MANY MOUTHS-like [Durio zibethinus]
MLCCFSLPLLFPLLLLSLLFIPPVSTVSIHAKKQSQPPNTDLQPTTMVPSEAEILFKIMESMSSDQTWRLSYPNPCKPASSWPGIECKPGSDNFLHVSRLDFGSFPSPNCKKTATFPTKVFTLPYLQSMFFLNCFTHTKTSLPFPNSLSNSSLRQLSLRSNPALVGPIPPQLSSLKSLQILTLSQNHFTGPIPVEIFSLTSLVHIDLSYNMLTGTIPTQVGNLKNLLGLDLSYNSLTGPIPETIGQLAMLQKLDLSSNSLVGRIPDSIEKLKFLIFMALSNNRLGGNFPKGLSKLQCLQYFIMDDNPMFVTLPVELGMLVKLQELRLANSGYSGTIPPSLSMLMKLSTLSLQNNRLTGEIPTSFASFSHIYHLNLSRNLLDGVVPFNASFLKRLGRNLDLSGNPGLCLSSTGAYRVKIGVGICRNNVSLSQPLNKSQAPPGLSNSFFLFGVLGVFGLHQLSFLL